MSNGRDYSGKRDSGRVKTSTKHPYGAFEHRVADSPAYANLSFSARSLLVLLVRQLTKDNNNGHLQATFAWVRPYGFDSQHTIIRGIRELVAHGMIYRSRSGGYQQGAALYAVTWLPIKNREGLSLDGFMPCAWRDWQPDAPLQKMQPSEKKSPLQKMQPSKCTFGTWTGPASAHFAGGTPAKSAHNVLVPVGARKAGALSADLDPTSRDAKRRNGGDRTEKKEIEPRKNSRAASKNKERVPCKQIGCPDSAPSHIGYCLLHVGLRPRKKKTGKFKPRATRAQAAARRASLKPVL